MKYFLSNKISDLKNVGKKTSQKLNKLGIYTFKDALFYFPARYDDYTFVSDDLNRLPDKEKVSLYGVLTVYPVAPRRTYCKMEVQYGTKGNKTSVIFFHKGWLSYKFAKGDHVLIKGTYNTVYHNVNGIKIVKMAHPFKKSDLLTPSYHLTSGIKQPLLLKIIKRAYNACADQLVEKLPARLLKKYKLEDIQTVVHDMHFPQSITDERLARRTYKFDELYFYQLKIQKMKLATTKSRGISINFNPKILRNFDDNLPFRMTSGQIQSVKDIVLNLRAPTRMNRLLQGDVGSGKTIVSAFAILATISAGYQCALMAPTGVLATQHAKNFIKTFKDYNITVALLTGEISASDKKSLLYHLKNGDINLIIGTDALIQPDVKFQKLGLAVIDEQHKFGVQQRNDLVEKGNGVNMLAMTATPIPRTLAITAYGDMDVSIIDTLPKGRKPIKTTWMNKHQFVSNIKYVKLLLQQGQQAYVVVPLVQQNGKSASTSKLDALTAYHKFQKIFAPFNVGLLHGQMDDNEKEAVMKKFKEKKYNILVATTVIEVGVDVADATMMIIWNADNFGLATLHQLRGRVGRNSLQSYCWLVAKPKTATGKKRMRIMEHTNNGFVISEEDMKLRGSGDIFGNSQSGVPKFKCADIVNDAVMLRYAKMEAQRTVQLNMHKRGANL